jgi:hypothetical protein
MTTFENGPAAGVVLMLKHSPALLRVVQSPSGEWDALDLPNDEPRPREEIFVYRLCSTPRSVHVRMSGRASGYYQLASYRLWEGEQPGEAILRDSVAWQAWCEENEKPREAPSRHEPLRPLAHHLRKNDGNDSIAHSTEEGTHEPTSPFPAAATVPGRCRDMRRGA